MQSEVIPDPPGEGWASGFSWPVRAIFQGGAFVVVCMMVCWMYGDLSAQHRQDAANHREDAKAFREELRQQNDHDEKMRRIEHELIASNQRAIEANQRDILSVLKLLTSLMDEVRRLKTKPDDCTGFPARSGLGARLRTERMGA